MPRTTDNPTEFQILGQAPVLSSLKADLTSDAKIHLVHVMTPETNRNAQTQPAPVTEHMTIDKQKAAWLRERLGVLLRAHKPRKVRAPRQPKASKKEDAAMSDTPKGGE